jgi:hypothetical protein
MQDIDTINDGKSFFDTYGHKSLFDLGLRNCTILPMRAFDRGMYPDKPYLRFRHRNNVLVFKDEETRQLFIQWGLVKGKSRRTGKYIVDYRHAYLGIFLGYPPSAVAAFINDEHDCFIQYMGIHFGTKKELVEENIQFLRDTVTLPYWGYGLTLRSNRRLMVERKY